MTPLMGIRLAQGEGLTRDWVRLDEMAPSLAAAVLAAEDSRFCSHGGIDWTEMRNAIDQYRTDDRVRGASTITMQTAKNLLLWPGRTFLRKGVEIYFAKYLELVWPKRRILEVYLNVAEWGPGVYGAEAAARRYFGKAARRLTAHESSLLAAVLPNPRRWRPDRPTAYISRRAGTIGVRSAQLGSMSACVRPAREAATRQ